MTDRRRSLLFGAKRRGELTRADEALLTTVARQASLAVRHVRLSAELVSRLAELGRQAVELAAARHRIMQAQQQERHRIERNIQDGVQQEIIASIAKVALARNQLRRDPGLAESTLAEWQADTRRTLSSLRELSRGIHPSVLTHGIHPSVLTHQGLVEALGTQASLTAPESGREMPSGPVRGPQLTAVACLTGNAKRFDQKFATTNLLRTKGLVGRETRSCAARTPPEIGGLSDVRRAVCAVRWAR